MTTYTVLRIVIESLSLPATPIALYYRRKLNQRIERDAALAAQALRGLVRVGEIDLPLPTDERWKLAEVVVATPYRQEKELVLELGTVRVDGDNHLYVGYGTRGMVEKEQIAYARSVWNAFRSREARKAVG